MTAPHILNSAAVLDKALSGASPDLMRSLLTTVINALLSAEADAVCGAGYGQSSPERVNSRNGYLERVESMDWPEQEDAEIRTLLHDA